MSGAWMTIKWVFGAVWALYFILQCVAIRRLHGDFRRRCLAVLRFMVIAVLLANGVRLIFDSLVAKRAELMIMGALGVVAIAMLARLFGSEKKAVLLTADS